FNCSLLPAYCSLYSVSKSFLVIKNPADDRAGFDGVGEIGVACDAGRAAFAQAICAALHGAKACLPAREILRAQVNPAFVGPSVNAISRDRHALGVWHFGDTDKRPTHKPVAIGQQDG